MTSTFRGSRPGLLSPSPEERRSAQPVLLGRWRELARIAEVVASARAGAGGVLLVEGEPGIGKSRLLDEAASAVVDVRVLWAAGRQFEAELPFAVLEQICRPILSHADELPEPQRHSLYAAFGLGRAEPADRFRVGLATVGLLAATARDRPVLCVIDDAQWLDHASITTLAFVSRRLAGYPVAVLVARHPQHEADAFVGAPKITLGPLADADARTVLRTMLRAPLDPSVRDLVLAEAGGNPLALLELARAGRPAELAGGFGLPFAPSLTAWLESTYRDRLAGLPAATRQLVLVAAADPTGDLALLWRAAARLGIGRTDAQPAEDVDLLRLGGRVQFRHPLVRSAVYQAAPLSARREVHAALSAATDTDRDPDRQAWHNAMASHGPDERVAVQLERAAARAGARGGVAAEAAFLELASNLSTETGPRAVRTLAAATAKHQAGDLDGALNLLDQLSTQWLPAEEYAGSLVLRARISFSAARGSDAARQLLEAARHLATVDRRAADTVFLQALVAATATGRPGRCSAQAVVQARQASGPIAADDNVDSLLLVGLVTALTVSHKAAIPVVQRAIRAFESGDGDEARPLGQVWLACSIAWDNASWTRIATRNLADLRAVGALPDLPQALNYRALAHIHAGQFAQAEYLIDEANELLDVIGSDNRSYAALVLAGWQGAARRVGVLAAHAARIAAERGEGRLLNAVDYANAVLNNGLGRYDAALRAGLAGTGRHDIGYHAFLPAEAIEAAAYAGSPGLAAPILEELSQSASVAATPWSIGIEQRCRALLGHGDVDDLYRQSLKNLLDSGMQGYLGRTYLLHGEWLRRQRRRREARAQLRTAHELLTTMGAVHFAARAARELRAVGDVLRPQAQSGTNGLTAQELRIARLVAQGASSKEIAAELVVSPRTVDAHLRKIFMKLGVTSRRHIKAVLTES